MKKLIDADAAIDHWRHIIDATSTDSGYNTGFVDGLEFCISHLSTMPSVQPEVTEEAVKEYCHKRCLYIVDSALIKKYAFAQPEREKGEWIYEEDEYGIDGYRCNKCGFFEPWDYVHKFINYIEDYNFCPNCGAKMEVKHEA